MQIQFFPRHSRSTNTDHEFIFTESLILRRKNPQSNLPSVSMNDEERKIIEGWTIQFDSQQHSHSMLHTLSRNIKSYEKMQRKLSERKNLRQLKEQYKSIRTTRTSRPQTTKKLQELDIRKNTVNTHLVSFTNQSRNLNINKTEQKSDILKDCSKNKHIKSRSKKVIQQMSQFDQIRQMNQKKINKRYHKNNLDASSSLTKSTKISHKHQLAKNIKSLQQKLKQILVNKNSRSIKTPIVDLTISVRQKDKNNQTTELIKTSSRQRVYRRSKSPLVNKDWIENQFEDSKIFNRYR